MLRPLTIAIAQFKPSKGAYDANVARIGRVLAGCAALDPRPDVVLLPETAPTGYFVEGGVRDLAVTAGTLAADLDRAYRAASAGVTSVAPLDVTIGFYEVWRNTLHNSAMYVTLGGDGEPVIHHVHRKIFLPTYGLFDEERFVERGFELRAFETRWGRAAILICEDSWHSLTGLIAALDGAEVVFVPSAAPARGVWPRDDGVPGPATAARWERLVRDIAEEHGMFVAYANLVGSEGGKSFAGSSTLVGPGGDVRARGPVWEEGIVSVTVDLDDLTRARADSPLLNDIRVALPHLLGVLDQVTGDAPAVLSYDEARAEREHGLVRADERGAGGAATAGAATAGPATAGPVTAGPFTAGPVTAGLATAGPVAAGPVAAGPVAAGPVAAGPVAAGPVAAGPVAAGPATAGNATAGTPTTGGAGGPPRDQDREGAGGAPNPANAGGIPVTHVPLVDHGTPPPLDIDAPMVERWLVSFLRDELSRRGFQKAIVGVSGGVDSAVTAFLAARALGPENVIGIRMPYRTSSPESLEHAQLVGDALGIELRTVEITNAVDGYLAMEPDADPARRGNVMARMRMIILFDLSSRYRALPLGTGNKTERLFGYFTWHADDSPPINPLGDLYKTQVWQLARRLGVPDVIIDKPASADLIKGQTDEGDFGISYARADVLLNWLLSGHSPADLVARGFDAAEVELVRKRLGGTHWKRRLPAVAMVSPTAIGEAYLRPVDY